jgi:hypothetical protein
MNKAKENGYRWAMPVPNDASVNNDCGLTKREYFAAMVLQGFAADPNTAEDEISSVAGAAVDWADALLAALEADNG